MHTQEIRQQVSAAVVHEQQTGTLAALLLQGARMRGAQPTPGAIGGGVSFIKEYIEHAPALLEALAAAGGKAGIGKVVSPIVDAAEQYFLAPFDFMPDQWGLVGLMDDAYLAHSLVQAVSERYRRQTGTPLLPPSMDLTKANQVIRSLIGEPLASQIDAAMVGILAMPYLNQALVQMPVLQVPFQMQTDPVWGNMSINEIVDHRMGMLGVL